MAKKKTYSLKITIEKGLKFLLFAGVPAVIAWLLKVEPAIGAITVGALLTGLANYLKHRNK